MLPFSKAAILHATILSTVLIILIGCSDDRPVQATLKPDKHIKELLHLKSGQPVLHIDRKLTTNKENFNIYSTIMA